LRVGPTDAILTPADGEAGTVNLHRLRIFYAVAQRRNITAAAGELMLSQPAVSLQLKSLERDLGLPLFQRGGPKLLLTDAGEVLYRAATSILFAKDEAERSIGELRDGTKGRLILGAGTTGGMYVLPRILQSYKEKWPETEIVMQVGTTDQLLEKLLQNGLDLAIVGGPIEDRRFKTETICTDVLVLIAAPTHPICRLPNVTLKNLGGLPFIVPEAGSRTRQLVERHLREAGVPLRIALQMPGTEGVKRAVEAGLGIGIVSRYAVEAELATGVLRALPIAGWTLMRPVSMVYRSQKYFSPVGERFRDFAKSYGAQHLEMGSQTRRAANRAPRGVRRAQPRG
jgi:DNA-binding transcriptional LysR family regulator